MIARIQTDLVDAARQLFPKIDNATQQVIALLGKEHVYHAIDLQLVMLGLPNRGFIPDKMQKRINTVEPISSEIETEKTIAAKKGEKAETHTERGIRLTNGAHLRIIDNGIILYITDGKPYRFSTDFKAIGNSALNEVALYRALAATAEEALNAPEVRHLREYVDELTNIIKAAGSGLTEEKRFQLNESLEIREAIYKDLFDKKRIKPKPETTLPAGEREGFTPVVTGTEIER